jgi:hypothetical protein
MSSPTPWPQLSDLLLIKTYCKIVVGLGKELKNVIGLWAAIVGGSAISSVSEHSSTNMTGMIKEIFLKFLN